MVGTPEWWRSKCREEGVMIPYRSCKGVRDDPVPGNPPGVTKRSDLPYFERRPYSDRPAPSSRAAASPGRRIAEPAAIAPAVRTARRVWKSPIAIAPLDQPDQGRGEGPATRMVREAMDATAAGRSYQLREKFTMRTTESITGTSISTPTTVASAAPDSNPN